MSAVPSVTQANEKSSLLFGWRIACGALIGTLAVAGGIVSFQKDSAPVYHDERSEAALFQECRDYAYSSDWNRWFNPTLWKLDWCSKYARKIIAADDAASRKKWQDAIARVDAEMKAEADAKAASPK